MKHKYKKFLLLAALLILALCMGALGVYHGVILPNSSELQTKRALKQLERVVAGSSRESFEKTLALMDDETLLCAIAEASLEAEEQGSSTQLAFFAPAAAERIGPKVTPAQLELLLRDDQYPAGFRSFMLEVTLYANGEEANGMILPSAAYTNMLKELIAEDGIEDDVLLEYALINRYTYRTAKSCKKFMSSAPIIPFCGAALWSLWHNTTPRGLRNSFSPW